MLVIDTETTFYPSSSPYHPDSKLVYVGILQCETGQYTDFAIEYGNTEYKNNLDRIRELIKQDSDTIGFNYKFDSSWLRRYGIVENCNLWDCQIAQYILQNQTVRMPSLDDSLQFFGLPLKDDKVRVYWDNGIDTTQIPEDILREYLRIDCERTYQLYVAQMDALANRANGNKLIRLIRISSEDTLITGEMESNGLKYDLVKSEIYQKELEQKLEEINLALNDYTHGIDINWNSGDDLSAFLYGGIIKKKVRESYTKILKSGEVKIKERWGIKEIKLSGIVQPQKRFALSKAGYYSTDYATLKTVYRTASKKGKAILDLLSERAKVEKKLSTYFIGIPKLMREKQWAEGMIHGTLNHTTTATGRLSSSAPNQQNLDSEVRRCIISRK